MKKELFFDRHCGLQLTALTEDGKLVEFYTEREDRRGLIGDVYKGKVTNVLAGMNAVFVSCGLEKNCYLSTEETYTDYTKYDGTRVQTNEQPLRLEVGDEILVQITKPARGNKGAKVTTHISFVGKRLIYLPETDFLGISRKITDAEKREKLLKTADKMRGKQPSDGFIVRTQAVHATQKQLKIEAEYLKNLHKELQEKAKSAEVGDLLYQDEDLISRTLRDAFGDELVAIHVGEETLYQQLLARIRLRGDLPERKLMLYTGQRSMFSELGITALIDAVSSPKIALPCGGYLVLEHTEALTVIDVNTGSFTGNNNLEETVFAVNLEAVEEIARQVRLRNVGGIVVVDFIDMVDEAHKNTVTTALIDCLAKDNAKCNVLPMSDFCITQFTRKRVGENVLSFLTKPCPHCQGVGYVADDLYGISRIRESILDCFANGYTSAIIELNAEVLKRILNEGLFRKEVNSVWKNKRVYCIPHKTYRENHYTLRGDNANVLTLPSNAQILY